MVTRIGEVVIQFYYRITLGFSYLEVWGGTLREFPLNFGTLGLLGFLKGLLGYLTLIGFQEFWHRGGLWRTSLIRIYGLLDGFLHGVGRNFQGNCWWAGLGLEELLGLR